MKEGRYMKGKKREGGRKGRKEDGERERKVGRRGSKIVDTKGEKSE